MFKFLFQLSESVSQLYFNKDYFIYRKQRIKRVTLRVVMRIKQDDAQKPFTKSLFLHTEGSINGSNDKPVMVK